MRRSGLGIVGALSLVVGGTVFVFAGAAAATTVSTEEELRAAFADLDETSIVLANDITLENCDDATGGDVDRNSITPLTVDGNGHTVRQQCEGYRVFDQNKDAPLTFTNITITNGDQGFQGDQQGGGIRTFGDVTLINATVTGNLLSAADEARGAGVWADGDITVIGSTISNNRAFIFENSGTEARGAGLFTFSGSITITDSVISGNEARSPLYAVGGGFQTIDGNVTLTRSTVIGNSVIGSDVTLAGGGTQNGEAHVTASTIANNTADGGNGNASAGGLAARTAVIVNSTITGNVTTAQDTGAGGLDVAHLTLVYSTVTSNTGEESANITVDSDFDGTLTSFGSVIAQPIGGPNCDLNGTSTNSHGYNVSDDTSCDLSTSTDVVTTADLRLGALGANGGPTPTRLPASDSPLLDVIPLAACQADGASGITNDQRLLARPSGTGCDVGAVEVQVPGAPIPLQPNFTG